MSEPLSFRTLLLPLALALCAHGIEARNVGQACDPDCDRGTGAAAASTSGSERAPRRVALLVGIGDYLHFTPDGPPGRSDLQGPPNDLERMRTSLRRWGFEGDDVRLLRDGDASKRGILDGFGWLAERASDPEDVVVIYYSGHGSFTDDEDGDEARLTPGDTRDEALVPWDASDIHAAEQLVLDDEIRAALERLGTTNVTILVDACYSGTATRGAGDRPLRRARGPVASLEGQGAAIEALDHPEHTLITAASARQIAEELPFREEGKVFGVLSYHLTRALDGAEPDARYDELMREVRRSVAGSRVPQTPQLEGDRGARVFRVTRDVARRPFALVTGTTPTHVTLDVGAVHSVRESAIYDVFGPGETAFRGEPLAQATIVEVGETRATAEVTAGRADRIPANARAVLARVPPGARVLERLPVFVDAPARRLRIVNVLLESLDWVEVVEDSAAATHVTGEGSAPEVRVDGTVLPHEPDEGEATSDQDALCRVLTRAFAINAFEMVHNPQPPLELGIEVRMVPTGTAPGGVPAFEDTVYLGERYDIYARVWAPEESTFYFSAAAEGFAGAPFVLYPLRADEMNEPFALNTWVPLRRGVLMVEPTGVEVIRAVANSNQYDLYSLYNSLPSPARECGRRGALREGRPKGDRWQSDPSPVTGWKAVGHRVIILEGPPDGS